MDGIIPPSNGASSGEEDESWNGRWGYTGGLYGFLSFLNEKVIYTYIHIHMYSIYIYTYIYMHTYIYIYIETACIWKTHSTLSLPEHLRVKLSLPVFTTPGLFLGKWLSYLGRYSQHEGFRVQGILTGRLSLSSTP